MTIFPVIKCVDSIVNKQMSTPVVCVFQLCVGDVDDGGAAGAPVHRDAPEPLEPVVQIPTARVPHRVHGLHSLPHR